MGDWALLLNGEGRIRTDGALADTLVFKTRAINHSTTSPGGKDILSSHHLYGSDGNFSLTLQFKKYFQYNTSLIHDKLKFDFVFGFYYFCYQRAYT